MPSIGDGVTAYAGSMVLGDVRVGDKVVIAANSVVISDVPDCCMVAGSPAVVKKHYQVG